MTFVKICGLTNLEDTMAAIEAGADYLGFILYDKSPRAVTLETIAPILRAVRETKRPKLPICVGVQVNPTVDAVMSALTGKGQSGDQAIMDYVQIHKMDSDVVKEIRVKTYNHIFIAIQPQNKTELISAILEYNAYDDWRRPEVPQFLVDAYHPTLAGGTGQKADYEIVADLPPIVKRMILAGGLTPENVAETIRVVHPWAVDVSSGVESAPGKKDHDKMRAFIGAVREADRV